MAQRGVFVFPVWGIATVNDRRQCGCPAGPACPSSGKHPLVVGWQGQATTSQAAVTAFFNANQRSNYAEFLGPSGVIKFDQDIRPDRDGREVMARFETLAGPAPLSWNTQTGAGLQLCLSLPDDFDWRAERLVTNLSALGLGAGVDVLWGGKYAVGVGSWHLNGRQYTFLGGDDGAIPWECRKSDPLFARPAPIPPGWLALLRRPARPAGPDDGRFGDVRQSLLYHLAARAGLLREPLRGGMIGVVCPWSRAAGYPGGHDAGSPSSTVLTGASPGHRLGGLICLHSKCDGRTAVEFRALFAPATRDLRWPDGSRWLAEADRALDAAGVPPLACRFLPEIPAGLPDTIVEDPSMTPESDAPLPEPTPTSGAGQAAPPTSDPAPPAAPAPIPDAPGPAGWSAVPPDEAEAARVALAHPEDPEGPDPEEPLVPPLPLMGAGNGDGMAMGSEEHPLGTPAPEPPPPGRRGGKRRTLAGPPPADGDGVTVSDDPTVGSPDPADVIRLTDLGNARRLVATHGMNLRHCKIWNTWLVWDGRRWARDTRGLVLRYAKRITAQFFREAADARDPDWQEALVKHGLASQNAERLRAAVFLAESEPGMAMIPDTFKLWLAVNRAPHVTDQDDAIWRRILRVPFDHTVPKADRDPSVKARLRDPALAGPAILAWAVAGCLAWQRDGLGVPPLIEAATTAYREDQDPLRDFYTDCCRFEATAWVSSADLYAAYQDWTRTTGVSPRHLLTKTMVGKRLRARGCEETRRDTLTETGKRKQVRCWNGLRLRETDEADLETRSDTLFRP